MSKKTLQPPAKPKQPPGHRGRPFEHPDPTGELQSQIEGLAAMGASNESIADFLKIDNDTMLTHYSDELKQGKSRVQNNLRMLQLKKAYGGNVGMLIWLGKQMLGQTENHRVGDWDPEKDGGFHFVKSGVK